MKKWISIIFVTLFILILIIAIYVNLVKNKQKEKELDNIVVDTIGDFNQKFTKYEGMCSDLQIKQLIRIVNVTNVEYQGNKVSINDKKDIIQYSGIVEESKKYKVECEKLDGAVCNINIYYEDKLIEVSEKQ